MTTNANNELSDADLENILGFALSQQQLNAVKAPREPAVMVAGAGSGKTTSMSARIAFLIGSGYVTPEQVLGLTFTTKATAQLLDSARSRIAELAKLYPQSFEGEGGDPVILTYNSFASGIVKEFGALLGRDFGADVLTDGARQQLAYRLVCNTHQDLSGISVGPAKITSDLLALDSELSELAIEPATVIEYDQKVIDYIAGLTNSNATLRKISQTSARRIALSHLVRDWRALKHSRELIEFSDQVRLATKIVIEFPQVASEIRSRFSIALLDEYQDTSISQRILLETIFSDGFPVTAVGDPCQAIYGWRGASVENINSFPQQFQNIDKQNASVYPLSANRRSGVQILELANLISENLRTEHPSVQRLDPTRGIQGEIVLALFDFADEELNWMADQIAVQHSAIKAAGLDEDIAVLAATGNLLLRMRDALQQRGVPVQLHSAAGLLSQPLVMDLRAILEIIHEPTANPSFVRWASGVKWRIGARDLAALGDRAGEIAKSRGRVSAESIEQALEAAVEGIDLVDVVSLSDALFDLGELDRYSTGAIERFGAMAQQIRSLRSHSGEPLLEFIGRVIRKSGIDIQAQLNENDAVAVNELVNLAADFNDIDGRVSLGAFISRLDDIERFDISLDFEQPVEKGAVQLITIYKAKGLEYTHVYLPNLSEGAFPGGKARGNWSGDATMAPWPLRQDAPAPIADFPDYSLTKLSEADFKKNYLAHFDALKERDNERLAYVAFTRAKDSLTLSGNWWGVSWKKPHGPHPFLTAAHNLLAGTSAHIPFWAPQPEGDRPEREQDTQGLAWPIPVPQSVVDQLIQQSAYVSDLVDENTELIELAENGDLTESESDIAAQWSQSLAAVNKERARLESPIRRVSLPRSLGASSMLRAMREPEVFAVELARPMPRKPNYVAARGTEIHAFIENYYGMQTLFDWDELEGALDSGAKERKVTRTLKEAFLASRFAQMTPVAVEQQFCLTISGRSITGYIDAIFNIDGRYLVVDWKTGGTEHLDPAQLAFYRLAWARIAGVDWQDIDTAFVMLSLGTELAVDTDEIIRDLERQLV
jgi:DNA helicase-2/ATP-dependent DNA helicase PcrA